MILGGGFPPGFETHPAIAQSPVAGPRSWIEIKTVPVRFGWQTKVPARRSGPIASIAVQSGTPVTAGQEILRLDDGDVRLGYRAAELRLQAARREAAADVTQRFAEVTLKEVESEDERSRAVQRDTSGAIAVNEMRRLRLSVERAKLQVNEAKEKRLAAANRAEVLAAELAMASGDLQNTVVNSPAAGVVIDLTHRVGEWVTAGDPVATLACVDPLRIDAMVDRSALPQSRCVGCAVVATLSPTIATPDDGSDDDFDNEHFHGEMNGHPSSSGGQSPGDQSSSVQSSGVRWSGRVESSDIEHLPGDRYRVTISINNQRDAAHGDWTLKPGMTVDLRLFTGQIPRTAATPRGPVRLDRTTLPAGRVP